MINKGLYTSKTDLWSTPQDLYDKLNNKHYFTLDPCCISENQKCDEGFPKDKGYNGLEESWDGHRVFMNPPYGREISKWVKKAYEESLGFCKVVALLPARTDTKWFHDYCYYKSDEIIFIKRKAKVW